jgi:hypothetical protein
MSLGQVRIPGCQPLPDGALAHLILGHRCDQSIMHEQPIHIERLVTDGVGGLELDGAAPFGVTHAGTQRGLEHRRLILVLHAAILTAVAGRGVPNRQAFRPPHQCGGGTAGGGVSASTGQAIFQMRPGSLLNP